jgi:tRNA pseudouridine13 synthase
MLGIPYPYLTRDLPGIGGSIKQMPEHFVVTEVPLYTPCGHGEHSYFEIKKVDLSTREALERLARELHVDVKDIGYAGLKDRKGVTRQMMSIAGVAPAKVLEVRLGQLQVLWARLHSNKLRIGHLKGNSFRIRIQNIDPGSEERAGKILEVLAATGIPNYYGPQRFGNRGDSHRIGRAFLKRDDRTAIRRILGYPSLSERNPHVVEARNHFMAGAWKEALDAFPTAYRDERRLLAYMLEAGENYAGARRRLRDTSRKLFFSAYQAYLFNAVLVERLERTARDMGQLFPGDVAYIHRNGAVFHVDDPVAEEPRAKAFEISPSGPVFGKKMRRPDGVQSEIEQAILENDRITATDFHQLVPKLRLEGGRRPLRVPVQDLSWRVEGADLCLEFFLPKGSYATTLLRELIKKETVPEGFGDE